MEKDKGEKDGGLLYNKLRKLITVIVSHLFEPSFSNKLKGRFERYWIVEDDQFTAYCSLRSAVIW